MYRSLLKFLLNVPKAEERPRIYADAVKTLDIGNSWFNKLLKLFTSEAKNTPVEWRRNFRKLQHVNREFYERFYRLCGGKLGDFWIHANTGLRK